MKHLLLIFTGLFITGYLFTESWAVESPKTNEIDALLAKVSKNINNASKATAMAKEVSQKMAEEKAKEKEQLKQSVTDALAKVEKMEKVQEMYAAKMIANGIDTTVEEVKMTGPAYDAYLNYVEEGGKDDFEYFRMYLWRQQK